MMAALKAIRAEKRRIDARIRRQVPAMAEIAEHGETAEARRLARRWLAMV